MAARAGSAFVVANGGIPLFFSSVLMRFKMSVSSWLHTTLLGVFFQPAKFFAHS